MKNYYSIYSFYAALPQLLKMERLLKLSNSPNPKSCILWLRPMKSTDT